MVVPLSVEQAPKLREKINALQEAMVNLPQVDCPIRHYFAPGLYAREITIPEGTTVVGAVHKTENLVVLSKGRLRIVTEDGTKEVCAPFTMTCPAGAKNAVVAMEDSVWTNFFPTTETDPEKLVEILTESNASDLLGGSSNKQLAANRSAGLLEK